MVHILELLRYGRLFTNDRSLSSIDRMFVYKRPYVFFNQPDVFLKHKVVCDKHQGCFRKYHAVSALNEITLSILHLFTL